MRRRGWLEVATYASGFEADFAIAQLAAARIPAVRDNNDTVGIFGPGFQGATARGVTVLVPLDAIEEARVVLGLDDDVEHPDDEHRDDEG